MKIDKNVPVTGRVVKGGHYAVVHKMDVGDSVFFTDLKKATNFYQSGQKATKGTASRMAFRAVEGGWRVWKVEREKMLLPRR